MNTIVKSLLALTLLCVLAIQYGCNTKTETPVAVSATVEELGQMNRDFAKALTDHDAVAAANLYDVNASLLPPNEPVVTGRDNIKKYWQGAIDAGVIDATVKTVDAKSNGNLGYEIGTFEMRLKGPNGDTIVDKGKYTEVLKYDSTAGKWISIYGMWSADAPAQ